LHDPTVANTLKLRVARVSVRYGDKGGTLSRGGFVQVETKVSLASQHLENMITNPAGMTTNAEGKNTWPTTRSQEYDNQDDGWKQDGVEG
jgi:hypothetical protein